MAGYSAFCARGEDEKQCCSIGEGSTRLQQPKVTSKSDYLHRHLGLSVFSSVIMLVFLPSTFS